MSMDQSEVKPDAALASQFPTTQRKQPSALDFTSFFVTGFNISFNVIVFIDTVKI